ncbi:MAG TPA: signal peptidase I [Polyangiaceae bacterium]|nr:signal peptidase I [Polyangiaceae bacterium]
MLGFVKFVVWFALFGVAMVAGLKATCIDFWTMPSDDALLSLSVLPTLEAGDKLILLRIGTPGFGDVVRCPDPEAPGRFVVGRILGEQGDRIVAETSSVTVNEKYIGTRRACTPPQLTVLDPKTSEAVELSCEIEDAGGTEYTRLRATTPPLNPTPYKVRVPDGHVFLASDNRHYHDDSRDFGPVPKDSCHNRVLLRLWSARGWFDNTRRFSIVH